MNPRWAVPTANRVGSVTTADLAAAIEAQTGIVIDKRKLSFDAVKTTGSYSATVKLHHDVTATLTVNITTHNPAAEAAKPEDEKAEEKPKTEKTTGGYKAKAKAALIMGRQATNG